MELYFAIHSFMISCAISNQIIILNSPFFQYFLIIITIIKQHIIVFIS